jgi:ribosomal protein S6--L-glutamate ligase
MRRVAQGQEFRSNVHRGGRTEVMDLDEVYKHTAVRAAQIMGLRFAGVDMLEGADGPQVMEVNSSPGLEGIETATGLDIAGTLIQYIKAQLDFPELDIRQKLTVSRGYDVAELVIPHGAQLVGKSIEDSGLKSRDVNVLSLHRAGTVIPNPKGTRAIEAGDVLLCFGKVETMRDLVPERFRNRRHPSPELLPASEVPRVSGAPQPSES